MLGRFGIAAKLFGLDPKLEFRKPSQGASLLTSSSRIPSTDSAYWSQYFTLFDSLSDVITLLDANTLQRATDQNLTTLVDVVCERLFDLLARPEFPRRSSRSGGPLGGIAGFAGGGGEDDDSRQALNCVRVLSRVVPYLFSRNNADGSSSATSLEQDVFWRTERVKVRTRTATTSSMKAVSRPNEQEETGEASQFVLEDEEDDDDAVDLGRTPGGTPPGKVGQPTPAVEEDQYEWQEVPALAERLLAALVDLAFVPGFTVPEVCRSSEGGAVAYVIWEAGIANPAASALPPTSPALLSTRLEVIRLLNVLLSIPSLITPPHLFPVVPNQWREAFVSSSLERKVVLCFLCSIINTALNGGSFTAAEPGSPTMSTSSTGEKRGTASALLDVASGAAGRIMRLGTEDVKGLLVNACLQSLAILLAQHHTVPTSSTTEDRQGKGSTATMEVNSFAYYVSKLHRPSDFELIAQGVLHVLDQATNEWPALLPRGVVGALSGATGSISTAAASAGAGKGSIAAVTEALIVLWRAGELNPKLWKYLVEERDELGAQLVVYLATFCLEYKDDETQLGLVRLSAFMMQSLSAEPGLARRWNAPLELKLSLRSKYGVPGTLADFLIVSIYTLVFTTKGRLAPLYPAFILSIDNASPHFKSLSSVSSTRLTQLFLALSAPNFLLMEEGNPRLVYYLLETFNNVIHHQLSDNPELLYALLRAHKRFDELSKFTLAMGVAEAKKMRSERRQQKASMMNKRNDEGETEERKSTSDGRSEGVATGGEGEGEGEVSEKARGKRRERQESLSAISIADLSLAPISSPMSENAPASDATTTLMGEADDPMSPTEEDAPFVGKNGFTPTESWVASWREGLPLDSILIAISELRPLILDLPARPSPTSQTPINLSSTAIGILSSASLLGLLPPPPQAKPRAFGFNPQSTTWLASIVYGNEYLAAFELLRDVPVALFAIATRQGGPGGVRGAVERVGRGLRGVVGGGAQSGEGREPGR